MLEFCTPYNAVKATMRLVVLHLLTFGFVGLAILLAGHPLPQLLFCVLAGVIVVTSILQRRAPADAICRFHVDRIEWGTSRDPSQNTVVLVANIEVFEIDLDDLTIAWNSGSMFAKGLGVEIDWDQDKLRKVMVFALENWPNVPLYVIELGQRRAWQGV